MDTSPFNDTNLENVNVEEYGNATIETVLEGIVQERNYNILLWTPFIIIPLCIIIARVAKWFYRIYLLRVYGQGEDVFDDPLAQLGLTQLGLGLSRRGYDDMNDIRKIRKEQKRLEKRLHKQISRNTSIHVATAPLPRLAMQKSNTIDDDELNEAQKDPPPRNSVSKDGILKPLYLAENYLRSLRNSTHRTWTDLMCPDAVRRWFLTSRFARIWMIFQVLATIIAIGNYVFLTYSIHREDRKLVKHLDVALAFIFLMDYSVSIYIAEDRLAFYFNVSSMIDLVSIVPPFIYVFVSESSQFVWFLGLLRILRASRILRTYRLLSFSVTEEKRELTIAALSFFNFIFLSASIINALENINLNHKTEASLTYWHDSLYYIMVTFSTIGFGDLTPSSVPSRVVVMILIIIVIIYVPIQSTRITEIYNSTSAFQRAKFTASRIHSHVILSGIVDYTSIINFCREFFATDNSAYVVVLSPIEPNQEVKQLLRHPHYRNRLVYLNGSSLNAPDLKRAASSHATSLFLVSASSESSIIALASITEEDEQLRAARGADAEVLMQALVVKKHSPGLPVFAQVLDARSEELSRHCGCDRVLCLDKIKMSILARECLVPGFMTMILNLVSTYKEEKSAPLASGDIWKKEYEIGALNQIYSMRVPPGLANIKWIETVQSAYRAFNVTFFAVMSSSGPKAMKLRLNPRARYITRDDDIVFFMSSGGNEVILRLALQFRDPIPKEHLQILELNEELDAVLPRVALSTSNLNSEPLQAVVIGPENLLDTSQMIDHIILCGHMTARGIRQFLMSIRSGEDDESLHRVKIVCIMNTVPELPSESTEVSSDGIWTDIIKDSHVSFIKGTPLKKSSLIHAGVQNCRRLVIFSTPGAGGNDGKRKSSQNLPDANSIFIMKMIEEEWPNTSFLVELVNGINVKYFSRTKRDSEWDTMNLRMQSILNNYNLSIHDRDLLFKKARQRGAGDDSFLETLRQFIFGSQSHQVSRKSVSGVLRKSYSRIDGAGLIDAREEEEKLNLADTGAEMGFFDQKDNYSSADTSSPSTSFPPSLPNPKGQDSLLNESGEEEEVADSGENPSGKSSASVSTAFLQRLEEEAELNESGFSPYPTYYFDQNFAMGRIFPLSFMHALLAQTYFRPFMPEIISALSNSVVQVEVPKKLYGRRYSELVPHMLQRNYIVLGLYRGALKWKRKAGSEEAREGKTTVDASVPYVYTNCRGYEIVSKDDAIFVIPSLDDE